MSSVGGIGGGITVGDIKGLDLETAMMAIQSQRANLLEGQLKTQMEGVQARNEEIAKLNDLIAKVKSSRADGDPTATKALGATPAESKALLAELNAAGLKDVPEGATKVVLKDGTTLWVNEAGKADAQHAKDAYWAFRSSDYSGNKAVVSITDSSPTVTQSQVDKWVDAIKGKIDSLNSSQQMDMLRMQSLTNKRNEAFDLMTNFMKKMADSRSSFLGNMR
jgi:hypothetical protein